jgi:glutathione S-transferase
MKLYDFPFAPNPQKVRVYLAEKGLHIPLQRVDITRGEHRTPAFLARNPMGSLPVLELDDGTCLTESLAIIEYLEELHPEPSMIGRTALERARVRELERRIETGIFNRIARIFIHASPVFAGRGQIAEVAAEARAELPRALGIIDAIIGDRLFAAGERPTIADCTLFAAFAHAARANVIIGAEHANLHRWHAAFRERPSARA